MLSQPMDWLGPWILSFCFPCMACFSAVAQDLPPAEAVDSVGLGEAARYVAATPDIRGGGFRAEFDAAWGPLPFTHKASVYQSRMTWTLAELHRRRPGEIGDLEPLIRHGLEYLTDSLWDAEHGGFRWLVPVDGQHPAGDGPALKHLYGQAFAIYAAANVYRALGDPAALDLACRGYRWVEEHARDPMHAGYHEVLTPDGEPVLTSPFADMKQNDVIGTAFGFKSMNAHLHLMEAYAELYRVWPDAGLRDRLRKLVGLVRDTMVVPPGCLNMFFTPDWRAVPGHVSFGHDVETAYLLLEAAELLGEDEVAKTWPVARRLVDHALLWGYDTQRGGFYDTGNAWGPAHDKTKVWWAQAEALNALMMMDDRFGGETDAYRQAFARTWAFCSEFMIDHELGGWLWSVEPDGTPVGTPQKANDWKGPYHTVRAMLNVADRLRQRDEVSP